MGTKSLNLMQKYMNSQLNFDLVNVAPKTLTHFLKDLSSRKCVYVFESTSTRSKINLEFVYLCIRSKDFAPISTISDYIHWAALAVWFCVFFITSMKSGKFKDLLHTYFILFNILHWNTTTQYQRFKLLLNVFVYCF